jgi:hypothetical protein
MTVLQDDEHRVVKAHNLCNRDAKVLRVALDVKERFPVFHIWATNLFVTRVDVGLNVTVIELFFREMSFSGGGR